MFISHDPVDKKAGNSISVASRHFRCPAGAPILMDYRNVSKVTSHYKILLTSGKAAEASRAQRLLPTRRVIGTIRIKDKMVDIIICDIGDVCVFVRAKNLQITGYETAKQINDDHAFIGDCK